jgi:DNA modification methylase
MNDLLNKVTQGDCLEVMRDIADKSVDLIVIDPPYNIGKDKRWDKWHKVDDYVSFMSDVFKECERVLKPTGSFYWFHNDMAQVSKLMQSIEDSTSLTYKQMITIDKPDNSFVKDLYGSQNHFRNYLNIAEYCLFYTFQDDSGLSKVMGDYSNFNSLKTYFKTEQQRIESDLNIRLKERLKWTTHFHWFAQGKSWGMCTEERYEELRKEFPNYFLRDYSDLRKEYETQRLEYENQRYKFNASDGVKNVWSYSFREDKKTKHPTQKPVKLIEDIISYSSKEGDVVLDFFLGSGTTAVAAINTNRHFIGIEREPEYVEISNKRIADALSKRE